MVKRVWSRALARSVAARSVAARSVAARSVAALSVAGLLASAGCGTTPQNSADDRPSATASGSGSSPVAQPSDTRAPVAKAGRLCKLLSHSKVDAALEVSFDVAAANKGGTSCVLQVRGHAYPDLMLTSSAAKVDAKLFNEKLTPDGSESVKGLGKAAYRVTGGAEGKAGPSAEVGWLVSGKIFVLRYTFEKGASEGQATTMTAKLVTLAKQLKTG